MLNISKKTPWKLISRHASASVASNRLGGRGPIRKSEVTNKRANGNSNHDHAIISHEEKPIKQKKMISTQI